MAAAAPPAAAAAAPAFTFGSFPLAAPARPTRGFSVAPPRVAGVAPLAAAVFFAGEDVESVGWRALDMLAAVGLIRRSRVSFDAVGFRIGGGGPASAFRARASEAAVGANSPLPGLVVFGGDIACEGVFGRDEDGVLGLAAECEEGVFGRDGVTDAREDGLDRGGVAFTVPVVLTEETEADVDNAGWKDEGGDLAGVRVVGFAPTALVLLSRAFDGVAVVRVVAVDGRGAPGFAVVAAFFGGEDGGDGETTFSGVTGETATGSTSVSATVGSSAGSGAVGSGRGAGAGGSGDFDFAAAS